MSDTSGFCERYGPWALVAGASVGLGAEFARQLAERGLNLILVARRPGPLGELSKTLEGEFGIQTRCVAGDLGSSDIVPALREEAQGLEVGLLVYNAALGLIGRFLNQDLDEKLKVIDVNCRGPVMLAHEFGQAMVERKRGGIILMSSVAGLQGSPLIATYAASKGFDVILGEALWDELREEGVDVLTMCAGATRTPNYVDSNPQTRGPVSAPVMEPAPVVRQALDSLGSKPSVVAGGMNRFSAALMSRILPRRLAVAFMGKQMRAMYDS